jgi:anthranilate/para-aminobenzoate synthase component I
LWRRLHPNPRHGFFLGSGVVGKNDSVVYMSVEEPSRVLQRLPAVSVSKSDSLPRFVGYLGFSAGRSFDPGIARLPLRPNPLKTPPFLFGDYRAALKVDLLKKQTTLHWRGSNKSKFNRLAQRVHLNLNSGPSPLAREGMMRSDRLRRERPAKDESAEFQQMVLRAKEAIARGDIYQANLSLRFERVFPGDPRALYRAVCAANPSPYAALLKCGDHWLVSNSPELLVKVEGRGVITRPIAGTRPRGKNLRSDNHRRGQLLLSPKERAEHIMLVDLERNDLGRVCTPGSVKVTERFSVEKYSHVMHIVSQVEGKLAKGNNATDVVKAVFPGGTITGCPKIRAIEWIEALEKKSRGPFYGSAGFINGNGDATFNILIRTALLKGRKAWVQAGAGIVADSNPAREYAEVRAKAAMLLETLESFS